MDDLNKQIPPPKSWMDFENLCHRVFMAHWSDPYAEKNGRTGQAQHGVDIFGSPDQEYGIYHGVQCKGKNANYGAQTGIEEIESEIAKVEKFSPSLRHWIFATTAPVDAKIQKEARKLSETRAAQGKFTVSVFGWEQIEFLLCTHKDVLRTYCPNLGFDLAAFTEELKSTLSSAVADFMREIADQGNAGKRSVAYEGGRVWMSVTYVQGRGLGPALMGRSMSASDAISCPLLLEVSSVVADLSRAYATRIVGDPGSGKSLCAYQAMRKFANSGWRVLKLDDPRRQDIDVPGDITGTKTLLFIDDAHIMGDAVLRAMEDKAGSELYILSTHNTEDGHTSFRNAIAIDGKRAVTTIANALMSDPQRTLGEVSKVDKDVGEKMMDVNLEDRVNDARERAHYPWQFCFILGGGWRRAGGLADAARQGKADIILAGLAIRQLTSRDEPMDFEEAIKLFSSVGIREEEVTKGIDWLVSQRLLVSDYDLRTPHQRFSVVVLAKILEGQGPSGRNIIGNLLQQMVGNESYPLAGKRLLLHELRFMGEFRQWKYLVPAEALVDAIEECWRVVNPEEKLQACYFLSELDGYHNGWPNAVFTDHEEVIATWISSPEHPVGWGLARLIHGIGNQHRDFVISIIEKSDPTQVAQAVNSVDVDSAAHLGELVGALGYAREINWYHKFSSQLKKEPLLKLAAGWPDDKDLWAFSKFCQAIFGVDEDLALDMAEQFIPVAQKAYDREPVEAFHYLRDMNLSALRIYDPLGVYVGKLGPKKRHRQIARRMLAALNAEKLAGQISETKLRDMQDAAGFLSILHGVSAAIYIKVVECIDWDRVDEIIGPHWDNLPHEAEVFLGVCYGAEPSRTKLNQLILDNLERMRLFPPRLTILSPDAALNHVEAGREIRLAQHDHVDWTFGPNTLALFAEKKPELLETVVRPAEPAASKSFSGRNHSWFREAYEYTKLLNEVAPQSLQRILDGVSVDAASEGWLDSLQKGGGQAKTVALLIECSLHRDDQLGELVKTLRKRFPRASVP